MESQRDSLGNAVVEAALGTLREKLNSLMSADTVEERKQVTVLFADLVDYTSLAEQMDAEDVQEVQRHFFDRCRDLIEKRGGVVEKYIGDAVVAVFGIPDSRESDPESSVLCGLDLLKLMDELNALFRGDSDDPSDKAASRSPIILSRIPVPLRIRIGIHTGTVVACYENGEDSSNFTIVGDTVNTASRLQGATVPDSVLISQTTFQFVRNMFEFEEIDTITLKGKRDPIKAFRVKSTVIPRHQMSVDVIEGIPIEMVGRKDEFAFLFDALERVRTGSALVATIVGESGIGKTRLLREFVARIQNLPVPIDLYRGRSSRESRYTPYVLMRDIFSFRYGITDNDPPDKAWRKFEKGFIDTLGSGDDISMKARIASRLLGIGIPSTQEIETPHDDPVNGDEAKQLRDRALTYISEYFLRGDGTYPVVLILEDLHWADDSSLDGIMHLFQTAHARMRSSLLIVGSARNELLERRVDWKIDHPNRIIRELGPLNTRETGDLVDRILRRAEDIPETIRDHITHAAEGNPFYVQELARILIDDKVIDTSDKTWRIYPDRFNEKRIPPTLTGILQARIDRLPRDARHCIQMASVIGRTFWDGAVQQMRPGMESADLEAILDDLENKELIFQRTTSSLEGFREFKFTHALLKEVAYEGILKRQRKTYHARTAQWLILQQDRQSVIGYNGLIADHLERAEALSQAVPYLRRAAEEAAARFANAEAIAFIDRALPGLSDDNKEERFACLLFRERLNDIRGQRDEQLEDLKSLEIIARQLGDSKKAADVALRKASRANMVGDYSGAIEFANSVITITSSIGYPKAEAAAYLSWGRALWRQGSLQDAELKLEKALGIAERVRIRRLQADIMRNHGIIAAFRGDYSSATERFEKTLDICRKIGDRRGEGATLNNLGNVYRRQGNLIKAKTCHESARNILKLIGDRRGESATLNSLAAVCTEEADFAGAKQYLLRALEICRESGDMGEEGLTSGNLGVVCYSYGDNEGARKYTQVYLDRARMVGDKIGEGHALADLGSIHHRIGDHTAAEKTIRKALTIAEEYEDLPFKAIVCTSLATVCLAEEKYREAELFARTALELRRNLGETHREFEPSAILAVSLYRQGKVEDAVESVEHIFSFLQDEPDSRSSISHGELLLCYDVLKTEDMKRARVILRKAHDLLMSRAERIPDDETRSLYLHAIPENERIVREFKRLDAHGKDDTLNTTA